MGSAIMTTGPTTTDAFNSPPDWATTTLNLACPRCGYNLRTLTIARCPECGLCFSWRDLLQAMEDEQTGSWTFEYAWRGRPLNAFAQTIGCCLLPWRLWTRLPLTATPRLGPLLFFTILTVLLILIVSGATDLAWHEYNRLQAARV